MNYCLPVHASKLWDLLFTLHHSMSYCLCWWIRRIIVYASRFWDFLSTLHHSIRFYLRWAIQRIIDRPVCVCKQSLSSDHSAADWVGIFTEQSDDRWIVTYFLSTKDFLSTRWPTWAVQCINKTLHHSRYEGRSKKTAECGRFLMFTLHVFCLLCLYP